MIKDKEQLGFYSKDIIKTSNKDDWETPQSLFNKLNEIYKFTLDPCATHENAKCKKYYTKQDNGLSKDWGGGDSIYETTFWLRFRQMG